MTYIFCGARYHIVFIDFGGATVTSPDHASDPIMIAGLGSKMSGWCKEC